jgi:hypothetical protein
VEDPSAKITPQVLAGKMDLVLQGLQHTTNLKEQPKQGECAVDNRSTLPNDYEKDLFDTNVLRGIVLDIPYPGQKISKAQNTQIQDGLQKTIANMIGNNNLDLESLTPEFLEANLTLSAQKISSILELKSIHDSLTATGHKSKGTDNQNISDRIQRVISQLPTYATERKLASKILEEDKDPLDHPNHSTTPLSDLTLDLPIQKSLSPDQKKNLVKSLRNIISKLGNDDTLQPADLNESSLRAKGISDKKISEIFQLKNILQSFEGKNIGLKLGEIAIGITGDSDVHLGEITEKRMGKMGLGREEIGEIMRLKSVWMGLEMGIVGVDEKYLGEEVKKLEQDMRKSAEVSRVEKDTQPINPYDQKLREAEQLRSMISTLPAGPKYLKKADRAQITATLKCYIQQ